MKKSERPKASQREDGLDLISSMPDGVLLLILSRLLFVDIVRSSILSKRWRYLWTAVPSLDIRERKSEKEKFKKSEEFKEFVYWVLANRSADLDCFRLYCSFHYSMSIVGRWIHVAVMKNVKQLDLTFWTFCPKEKDVEMPHCLVTCSSLEVLGLNLWLAHLRLPSIMGFQSLRVLDLTYVCLLGNCDLVKAFFDSCPLLEDLSFESCFMEELDLLCLSCPKLKNLRIENEISMLMRGSLRICCPNLVDLDLRGNIANSLFFECLDSLKEAVIQPKLEESPMCELFPGISSVQYLTMDLYLFSKCINDALDPALPNLKTLVLNTTMDAFTMDNFNRIVKYYPKVESLRLIIEQDFHGKYEWLDDDETRRVLTSEVKRIEFFEFNGEKPELVIDWCEDMLKMFFTWGDEARFSLDDYI